MLTKLIGFTHKKGTFNDKPYDNYILYLVKDEDNESSFGLSFVAALNNKNKVKAEALANYLECSVSDISTMLKNLIVNDNNFVDVYFNEYGNLDGLSFFGEDNGK